MLRRVSGENQPWGEVSSAIHLSWWTPLFRGDLSGGKDLLARLEAQGIPARIIIPADRETPFTVTVEVDRRWLARAESLTE
jgi:hypothetical protein